MRVAYRALASTVPVMERELSSVIAPSSLAYFLMKASSPGKNSLI